MDFEITQASILKVTFASPGKKPNIGIFTFVKYVCTDQRVVDGVERQSTEAETNGCLENCD